jgi:peptidoglycan-associated lipoprotein
MKRYRVRVFAIAALASGPIVTGCGSGLALAQAPQPAFTAAALPRAIVLAQADPVLTAQAPAAPAPAASGAPAPAPEAPLGLPRLREYRAIPELRDIYFDFGKAVIRPADAKILDANAAWLRANPDQLVLIEGHADNRGLTSNKNEFNMALGERRAQAAMNYLVAHGVESSRITILSYGEERPLCAEEDERCWSQNRRSRFLAKPR